MAAHTTEPTEAATHVETKNLAKKGPAPDPKGISPGTTRQAQQQEYEDACV